MPGDRHGSTDVASRPAVPGSNLAVFSSAVLQLCCSVSEQHLHDRTKNGSASNQMMKYEPPENDESVASKSNMF